MARGAPRAPEASEIAEPKPRQLHTGGVAVELLAVDRSFGDRLVLDNVSLRIDEGEVFGLVGPSGSGKTTAVKLIVGLLRPSSGEVTVQGVAPTEFGTKEKSRIGYMPQSFSLYPSLTVLENARFMASLYGVGWLERRTRIRDVLRFLDLWEARGRLAQHLSGGMQRRLALAGAILHRPSLIVVDEPTAGLDPALRLRIWDYLRSLRDLGSTIILTTQYIEEAEKCDGVCIVSEGKIAAVGSPGELRRQADLPDVIELDVQGADTSSVVYELRQLGSVRGLDWDGVRRLVVWVTDMAVALPEIESLLADRSCTWSVSSSQQASFEAVFMRFTGQA
jgi:ABC-2 type transport system ATP-binding protein